MVRAGWSGMKFSASKLSHSASSSGPSATSQPMATKTSSIWSIKAVIGWTAPVGASGTGRVTSTRSSTRRWASSTAADLGSPGRPGPALIRPRAWPIRLPASLRACGGRAPISRLASAIGDRSPAWASRAALSSASEVAAANAASASATAASTFSASNGVTWTGS